ncbi:MAG TPA: pirin family protein [Tepidisphaeraceae bacterium]|jgi:redox-sensitive bicupin YhaK (pirin superfamily)
MISIIPSAQRHHANHGWLDTHWHFSFSDYYDPKNMNWGPLRVFNDDIIQGAAGFPEHPHRDMEIITYVLDGTLEHRDHLGNRGVIHPGEVQVMSAGKGIVHAEYNHSADVPVHLLQLWVMPRTRNLPARWEQKQFGLAERTGKLLPVVSDGSIDGTLRIDQDTTIYVSRLPAGTSVEHVSGANRHAYLFVTAGELEVNGQALATGDQARIENEPKLALAAKQDAEFILLDMV